MLETYFTYDGLSAVFFGVLCFTFVFLDALHRRQITFLGWAVLFYGLIYGLSTPLISSAIQDSPSLFVGSEFVLANTGSLVGHTIAAILSVFGVIVGWVMASAVSRARRARARPVFVGLNNTRLFSRVFWGMLIVGVIAQILYSIDYGGLFGVIDYSRLIRANLIDASERSRFSFLSPLAGFVLLACFGFLGLLISRVRNSKVIVGFFASLIFSFYLLYTWQGRLGSVTFIAIILLAIVLHKRPHPGLLVAGFLGIAIGGMYLVYMVSEAWDLNNSRTFAQFYTRELSFVFTGFWAEVSQSNNTFRSFYDVLVLPLFLLPSSITMDWFENVKDVHTAVMMGAPKGEGNVTGGMPVDIITMGYLQFDVFGIFLYGILFGVLLRSLQTMVDHIEVSGIKAVLSAYIALHISAFALFYAHPQHVVAENFPLLATLILLFVVRAMKGRKASVATVSNNGGRVIRFGKELARTRK